MTAFIKSALGKVYTISGKSVQQNGKTLLRLGDSGFKTRLVFGECREEMALPGGAHCLFYRDLKLVVFTVRWGLVQEITLR